MVDCIAPLGPGKDGQGIANGAGGTGGTKPLEIHGPSWYSVTNGSRVGSRLALSKAPGPAGTYPVVIQPKDPKGAGTIDEVDGFTLKGPEITGLSSDHGGVGAVITINGQFFGSKKGKVYLGAKSCAV
jgi:hypothetical protein